MAIAFSYVLDRLTTWHIKLCGGGGRGAVDHGQNAGHDHSDHKMTLDAEGMVMNWNDEQLPNVCQSLNKEYQFTVKAGVKYAEPFNDTVFGFDQHEFYVEPCSKVTVTFINEDEICHQWMMHVLPKCICQQGMFHREAAGGAIKVGTFIVPSGDKTYLAHCDIAQHVENGMKSQLVVGKGSGDLTSIPGVTGSIWPDQYAVPGGPSALLAALFFGFFCVCFGKEAWALMVLRGVPASLNRHRI